MKLLFNLFMIRSILFLEVFLGKGFFFLFFCEEIFKERWVRVLILRICVLDLEV